MTIEPGQRVPEATFKTMTADGPANIATGEIFAGKKVVLFGVPGAFTPTCSMNHLPGFIENHDAILAKGVDAVAVVAVNDHHVMRAWAKGPVKMLQQIARCETSAPFGRPEVPEV